MSFLFGKHMCVGSTDGEQFSAVNGYHKLAEHTILASFQFDPGSLLSREIVFDPGDFTRFLKSFSVACLVLFNWMHGEQSIMYYFCNASDMCSYGCGCFGQLPFRQKGSDKNHTSLGPHKTGVICGFVFSSDQVCSQGFLVIGSMVGMYFSHGLGLYSCIFGVHLRLQWFPKLYTYVPILWNTIIVL